MDQSITIDNRYFLAEKIKEGGFGIVHKGFDLKFDNNPVAVKEILPSLLGDQKALDMFQDEARMTKKLQHPNIVTILDLRKTDKNQFYIIMEYVEGIDLRILLERCEKAGKCLPIEFGVYIIGEVCKALNYVHNKKDPVTEESLNIIHRDISPSNIMVTTDGTVKVIDFGIAKARHRRSKETKYGISIGKLSYMSPEQVDCRPIDHRSDLFSLGIVMFEVITGKKLFWCETERSLMNMIADARIDPSMFEKFQIPSELKKIILRAVQKDLAARYQSGREMYEDIHKYLVQINKTDLSFSLSEFIRMHYAEIQKSRQKITKEQIKPDIGTKIIKTISVSSDPVKRFEPVKEEKTEPLHRNETIAIREKHLFSKDQDDIIPPQPAPSSDPGPIPPLPVPKKDYRKEITIAAGVFAAALVLFVTLAIAIPFTKFGEKSHDSLFPPSWEINTVPSGSRIILNYGRPDQRTLPGKTPLIFKARPGQYPIRLYHAGFGALDRTLSLTDKNKNVLEYTFDLTLAFESNPPGATVRINGKEYLNSTTPCTIQRQINEEFAIEMKNPKGDIIAGFTFRGLEMDPLIEDNTIWTYATMPDSMCILKVTGNLNKKRALPTQITKKISAFHLKKALELEKLKEDDHLIRITMIGKDTAALKQLSWYYRRVLPDTVFWQEADNDTSYKWIYFGPIDPQYSEDDIINTFKLDDLKMLLSYVVLERLNRIEDRPVMTVKKVFPLASEFN